MMPWQSLLGTKTTLISTSYSFTICFHIHEHWTNWWKTTWHTSKQHMKMFSKKKKKMRFQLEDRWNKHKETGFCSVSTVSLVHLTEMKSKLNNIFNKSPPFVRIKLACCNWFAKVKSMERWKIKEKITNRKFSIFSMNFKYWTTKI